MGSPCHVSLFARNHETAKGVATAVIADVEALERRYSRYRPDSALSELNRSAASPQGMTVDDEMAGLLDYAQNCYVQSGGLFDVTSGILRKAWNFSGRPCLPEQKVLEALLMRVGWEKLSWERPILRFHVKDMELDFGGIAKEYAADRAVTLCLQHGLSSGVVNFGGDIRVIGPKPDGTAWEVGIRDPHTAQRVLATLHIRKGAVATSGDYERCFEIAGKRYGHILNPKTGWPVQGLSSVSVVAPYAVVAGSASTIAMLKGHEGPEWLGLMGLPCLWVTEEGEIGQMNVSPEQLPAH